MFEGKWALLVGVAFDTSRVRTRRQSCLFKLKTAMCVMAIAALHCSFENFVMKRLSELMLCFGMTTHAELRVACLEQMERCHPGLEVGLRTRKRDRARPVRDRFSCMCDVAIGASNIVAPVFTSALCSSLPA
jgi:hypothetical protein